MKRGSLLPGLLLAVALCLCPMHTLAEEVGDADMSPDGSFAQEGQLDEASNDGDATGTGEAGESTTDEESAEAASQEESSLGDEQPNDELPALGDSDEDVDFGTYECLEAPSDASGEDDLTAQASVTYNVGVRRVVCYDEAYRLLGKANTARSAKKISSLTWNTSLERFAIRRATEMALSFSASARPNGVSENLNALKNDDRGLSKIYASAGYTVFTDSDSLPIDICWKDYDSMSAGWTLNAKATRIGAACVKIGDRYFIYVVYGSGSSRASGRVGTGTSSVQTETIPCLTSHLNLTLAPVEDTILTGGGTGITMFGGEFGDAELAIPNATWQSSNTRVATVHASNGNAYAMGVSAGFATIRCMLGNTTLASCTVTVSGDVAVGDYDLANLDLCLRQSDLVYLYTGSEICPFEIWDAGDEGRRVYAQDCPFRNLGINENSMTQLKEGVDFIGAYSNNVNPGTATARLMGIGSNVGSKQLSFTIVRSPFVDVSTKTAHANHIIWLQRKGITDGWKRKNGTKEFRPSASVARGDMAAFLFRLAERWGYVSSTWQPSGTASFADVNKDTSHYREIMWLAEEGISKGWPTEDGLREFRPNANVARGDMAAFLCRLGKKAGRIDASYEQGGSLVFSDVTRKTAHVDEIMVLYRMGVSTGWQNGSKRTFRPSADVARGDMAAFLRRLDAPDTVA